MNDGGEGGSENFGCVSWYNLPEPSIRLCNILMVPSHWSIDSDCDHWSSLRSPRKPCYVLQILLPCFLQAVNTDWSLKLKTIIVTLSFTSVYFSFFFFLMIWWLSVLLSISPLNQTLRSSQKRRWPPTKQALNCYW